MPIFQLNSEGGPVHVFQAGISGRQTGCITLDRDVLVYEGTESDSFTQPGESHEDKRWYARRSIAVDGNRHYHFLEDVDVYLWVDKGSTGITVHYYS